MNSQAEIQQYEDDDAYCTEFVDHDEISVDGNPLFAFVCPKCGEENDLEGEPDDFKNKPFRCVGCNWVSLLVDDAIDQLTEEVMDR